MPNTIEPNLINDLNTTLLPIGVLIAESTPSEVARIRSNIDPEFQNEIQIASSYEDLLAQLVKQQPQLLILGRVDKSNYFEICQACHKIREKLPIVLISRQQEIDSNFRQLARGWGAIDCITYSSVELNRLFLRLDRPVIQQVKPNSTPEPTPTVSSKTILAALAEIVMFGNNYFGPLAQGNYWRKARDRVIDDFPFIQQWSADHFSKIGCDESILERKLTASELSSLRMWVGYFVEECERIIVDFGEMLTNSELSPTAKNLLAKSS